MNIFYKRTWAQVDLSALKNNIARLRELSRGKELIAVVKANCYGHGDVFCCKALNECGVERFAVSNYREAERLCENGIAGRTLIFGHCDIPFVLENASRGFIFTVGSVEYARGLSAAAAAGNIIVPIHIKIDTGMSRVGINSERELDEILSLPALSVEAAYTHFAVSDSLDEADREFTEKQQARLLGMCRKRGLKTHSQNSGGIIYHGDFDGDFVRAGIIMYGQKPDSRFPVPCGIKPLMSLKSVVAGLRTVGAGDSVSYGRTFRPSGETRLALIPCGYADGFNRRLSNNWNVIINGRSAPVRGRICMDQTLVDVTEIPDVKLGDEVTVYSNETEGGSSFTEAADRTGTINYELLCAVGARVPRVYVENGEVKGVVSLI